MKRLICISLLIQILNVNAQWIEIGGTSTFLQLANTSDTIIHGLEMCVTQHGKVYYSYWVADNPNSNGLLEWSANTWKIVPGITGQINVMSHQNGLLYVAGDIKINGNKSQVAIWNDTNWIDLGIPCASPSVYYGPITISASQTGAVYVSFEDLNSIVGSDRIYGYENHQWTLLPSPYSNSNRSILLNALVNSNGDLYCNGLHTFLPVTSKTFTPHFTKYNGTSWDIIDTTILFGTILDKQTHLILGGVDKYASSNIPSLYTYSSSILSPISDCVDTTIFGSYFIAAGNGGNIYSMTANKYYKYDGINKWNGNQWNKIPYTLKSGYSIIGADTLGNLYVSEGAYGYNRVSILKYSNAKEVGLFTEQQYENAIAIYPNPCFSNLTVILKDWNPANKGTLQIIDVLGVCVFTQLIQQNNVVNVSSLPKGLYTLVISTVKGVVVKKLVKE